MRSMKRSLKRRHPERAEATGQPPKVQVEVATAAGAGSRTERERLVSEFQHHRVRTAGLQRQAVVEQDSHLVVGKHVSQAANDKQEVDRVR